MTFMTYSLQLLVDYRFIKQHVLLISFPHLTEIRDHLSTDPSRSDQWNLACQRPLPQRSPQTRAICWSQLSPSGLPIFSPLSQLSSQ